METGKSSRSHKWCSRLLRVNSRGEREAAYWGARRPSRQRLLPARARGRCLWPPPGDFERTPRSGTEGGGLGEDKQGPAPGPTANSCPPSSPTPFYPGFLPSFLPVGGTVKPPSPLAIAEPGVVRKTSIALKGVLLAVMLAEGRSLGSRRDVGGWLGGGFARLGLGLRSWAGSRGREERGRCGCVCVWGGRGGVSCRILYGAWLMPTLVLSTQRLRVRTRGSPRS